MNPIAQKYFSLSEDQKKSVHLFLCEKVLGILDSYVENSTNLTYVETVVGTTQDIAIELPLCAIESIKKGHDIANVKESYLEPLAALQDGDLEFPDEIEFAYYAIYNAFALHVLERDIDHWLIVNQALSALGEIEDISTFKEAVEKAA